MQNPAYGAKYVRLPCAEKYVIIEANIVYKTITFYRNMYKLQVIYIANFENPQDTMRITIELMN